MGNNIDLISFIIIALGAITFIAFILAFFFSSLISPTPSARKLYICDNCLTVGVKKEVMPGHWLIQALLYLVGVVPGIIYSSWRLSSIKRVCPVCSSSLMVPVNTPRGKKLLKEAESGCETDNDQLLPP